MPAASPSALRDRNAALHAAVLQQAAEAGAALMGKLVASARLALETQETRADDWRERDGFAQAASQLHRHAQALCLAYPQALQQAFASPHGAGKATVPSVSDVHFDQLEQMDDAQVQSTITVARMQQMAHQAAAAPLAELQGLVCSLLGLEQVQADANVLRPETYVQALQAVVEQTGVAHPIRLQWFHAMAPVLAQALCSVYAALIVRLQQDGVLPVPKAAPDAAQDAAPAESAPAAAPLAWPDSPAAPVAAALGERADAVDNKSQALLTLDKLRRLLSGELGAAPPASRVQQFAAQFAQQFDDAEVPSASAQPDFDSTIPAALEALTEMAQVDRVVQSLEQRRSAGAAQPAPRAHSVEGQRLALRRNAKDVAQALSLEVVTLMVDNMAHDARLLEPVRQVIRQLEPALLRLALVDPRFFSNKEHPARRMLQAVSHQSMAFASHDAAGFETFFQGLQSVLSPLYSAPVVGPDVFEEKLAALHRAWDSSTQGTRKTREVAVEVLRHAEARNLLAEHVARSIAAHPDSARVPAVVTDFLCGPWAQVVAEARLKQGAGSAAADKFEALIPALLWSAHPDLARANPTKLTRLVPRLLATLREGLETIQYPGTRTSVFLEALMALHQQVFRPAASSVVGTDRADAAAARYARTQPLDQGNPWMAPQEAEASNFVGLDAESVPPEAPTQALMPELAFVADPTQPPDLLDMPLGSWVEMWSNDQWVRTQLTWASPQGTLFLFTGVFGATQSLSRRLRDKLVASGKLRLLTGHAFVDGALDAVAQAAIRNSLDTQT